MRPCLARLIEMNLPHTGATDTARQSSSSANPEAWVDEHGDCLYRYAVMRVRHPEVAEDLVQETLLAAVRTQTSFRGTSSERSWLCGILKNKICDHFRKLAHEVSFTDLEFLEDEMSHKFIDQGLESRPRPCRMEARSGGCVGSQVVLGYVSELPGQTDATRRRRVYASGDGGNGRRADLRRAPDFAEQSMGHATPGSHGSARVSGDELVP